mmetsp:Transcript_31127/g.60078  ORF Transcript_31127/g.60078 Transcript_31127/m.60078 type:complete len:216 (-) Transcript_31127:1006-1653(-)
MGPRPGRKPGRSGCGGERAGGGRPDLRQAEPRRPLRDSQQRQTARVFLEDAVAGVAGVQVLLSSRERPRLQAGHRRLHPQRVFARHPHGGDWHGGWGRGGVGRRRLVGRAHLAPLGPARRQDSAHPPGGRHHRAHHRRIVHRVRRIRRMHSILRRQATARRLVRRHPGGADHFHIVRVGAHPFHVRGGGPGEIHCPRLHGRNEQVAHRGGEIGVV